MCRAFALGSALWNSDGELASIMALWAWCSIRRPGSSSNHTHPKLRGKEGTDSLLTHLAIQVFCV